MCVILITLLFFLSQYFSGGKEYSTLLLIEILGSILLLITLSLRTYQYRLSKAIWVCIITGFLIPILYLIPISLEFWQKLPYRSHYQPILEWVIQQTGELPWLGLSLIPQKTFHALIAITPLLAIFLATTGLERKQLKAIIYIFLLAAGFQAAWGIIQHSSGSAAFYRLERSPIGSAIGGYLNRDHFSVLLYLATPISMGLLFSSFQHHADTDDDKSTAPMITKLLLSILIIMLIATTILAASRAGIFLIFLAFIISLVVFSKNLSIFKSAGIAFVLAGIASVILSSIGIIPVINRFIALDPFEDGRAIIFKTTIEGIKAFFPIGSGPSTFQEVFRNFQAYDDVGFTNHAHNDYLELLFETGLVGAVWGSMALIVFLSGWWFILKVKWDELKFIKMGAGISTTLFLLHGLVDFNFHTPANALAWCFLAAIFLRKESKQWNLGRDLRELKTL